MRKLHALWMSTLLVLTACIPVYDNDEEIVQENTDDSKNETAIVPRHNISEEHYKTILTEDGPKQAKARGTITRQLNNRLDIDEMETGLQRHSKEYFDPESHFFQAGQYLERDTVLALIDGLNPDRDKLESEDDHRKNPRVLSHILEQNYLKEEEEGVVKLAGISIGLALKSTYSFQTEIGGPTYDEDISEQEILKMGQRTADQVIEEIRKKEGLENVPIMIALYREEDSGSAVPGNFIKKAYVKGGSTNSSDWKDVNEDFILFPSGEAEEKHYQDSQLLGEFRNEVSKYFPNFVGFVGEGFYVNDNLEEVSIEIPIQFQSKNEVVGFTQYVYGLVMEMFNEDYEIEVKISSNSQPESVIVKERGKEEPYVHIY
ncbi:CamS family sex pheromone protein [Thalassobacillus devorans]|uniref:CamS family sex pheromone protein n=1 Tax=Thalassobacillus devorans TaxID=279813 RepID=UPI000A1CDE89|nr:CamS family sex pheromone protein [Thalassobacillus devorans]